MKISQKGLEFIKSFEDCKLHAYRDVANILTIGYGHTKDVKAGDRITQEQAEAYFKEDVESHERGALRLVKVPLTQGQTDALVSLAFNIGVGAFGSSTLLKRLNAGNYASAADQFLVWNKSTVNGKKIPVAGLTRRRTEERKMFIS